MAVRVVIGGDLVKLGDKPGEIRRIGAGEGHLRLRCVGGVDRGRSCVGRPLCNGGEGPPGGGEGVFWARAEERRGGGGRPPPPGGGGGAGGGGGNGGGGG